MKNPLTRQQFEQNECFAIGQTQFGCCQFGKEERRT
jgi:hypothetical protein